MPKSGTELLKIHEKKKMPGKVEFVEIYPIILYIVILIYC